MLTHDFSSNVSSDNSSVKKMDSTRNHLRRIASHKDTEFSNQSIMKAMETFVEAVQEMDETILVPCRLMDLQVSDDSDAVGLQLAKRNDSASLDSTNLHALYSLVNCVKKQLLWSSSEGSQEEESRVSLQSYTAMNNPAHKGHIRRPSTASMASTNSSASTISDTDSDTGIEIDSGVEGESDSTKPSYTEKFDESFRRHLYGLQRSLEQMTDAAVYLSKRYQNEVGGSV